jgi:acetylornithine deacetylase/succinyl-diaminopimelate desuccinylase-like protein
VAKSTKDSKPALNSKLVEKILAEIKEEEIVAMCCDVINIQSPTGEELHMAEYMQAVLRQLGLAVTWQEVEDGRQWRRQEPDVQRPHGYFEHRSRRFPDRHRI